MTPERMQAIIDAAREQLDSGVIYEPRGYPVLFENGGTRTALPGQEFDPSIDQPYLTNGEQFPVVLTHVVLAPTDPTSALEFMQRVGLRFRYHDNFYPNPFFQPLPAWQNHASALPAYLDRATAVWTFDKPNILSAQDTLKVTLRRTDHGAPTEASVAFHGFGLFSRRPYVVGGSVVVPTGGQPVDVNAIVYRDDSSEPIALFQMVVTLKGSAEQDAFAQGELRALRIQVRQSGNASRANWFQPTRSNDRQAASDQVPAVLVGAHGGQGVVHRLAQPWIWNPGEGFTASALNIDLAEVSNTYAFGAMALGHIVIR